MRWLDLHELEKFMAHQAHNKGRNHGIKSPLRVSVITNQMWQLIRRSAHSAESRCQFTDQKALAEKIAVT